MKTKKYVIALLIALVAGVGVGVTSLVLINTGDKPEQKNTTSEQTNNEQSEVVSFTAEADKSVLDQLTERAVVETKDSQYGIYVDAINGKKGGDGGKYWTFYIDGQMAQIGAGEYITEGGETVEWKFE